MGEDPHPEFRWLERGEGEPVVLLHGLLGRMEHWEAQLEGLGDEQRLIAPSLPIFDARLGEVSIGALAAHVVRLLDALDLPRAVIVGHSLGGQVALTTALDHPDRVSGLVLAGASGAPERSAGGLVPRRPTAAYVRARMEEAFFDPRMVTPAWVESVREILATRSSARRVLRVARAARRHRVEERLGEIAVPALLVWGADDRITPPDAAARVRALISASELQVLPRCGHAPMLERPAVFNDVLEEWLARTRARRERPAAVAGATR